MRSGTSGVVAVLLLVLAVSVSAAEDMKGKCNDDVQKMMDCLSFAKGSSPTPSKECCNSMSEIREKDPKCLCYIIQKTETGAGAEQLKNLGVQMAKLLQLPSACQLRNTSISNCPKILGIPPNSPDAAIFNSANTTAAPAGGSTSAPERSENARPTAAGTGTRFSVPMLLTALAFFLQLSLGGALNLFSD